MKSEKGKQSNDPNRPNYKAKKIQEEIENPEGYPEYPSNEDIYKKYRHESEVNPEDPTKPKIFNTLDDSKEADTAELSGKDLDIPGAELDDDQEEIGTEDEENNYYSLGGDSHENLEENDDEQ